ncbi:helix-turn-helix domain-containing protein [Amycolatopsis panacis]|uniref:XRE family transcriptional regulator n=1 Tax=Amycolatopsis panacis TaxID=2340917 RepID=A0A419I0H8_9PSEU|nr:helix-turn-helix transcriptional regulator [Amycolatopsis panacis]RJQ83105.1 XRE family transcriptional regulator [Amycolatopsis panacis]
MGARRREWRARGSGMLSPRVRALGATLRSARLDARFGLRELARRIGTSPALLSNWELGQRAPSTEDVSSILGALGAIGDTKELILSLASGALGPGWFTPGTQSSPAHFATLTAHERAATGLVVWAPLLVPDLLQIADYARFACASEQPDPGVLEQVVAARLRRRDVLFGVDPVQVEFFIGDALLRSVFTDDDVMCRQLRFIADLMVMSRTIRVRILPDGAAPRLVPSGAFTQYRMKDAPPVIYCSHHGMGAFLADAQAALYEDLIERLDEAALSQADSLVLLTEETTRLARALESQREVNDATLAEILAAEERID